MNGSSPMSAKFNIFVMICSISMATETKYRTSDNQYEGPQGELAILSSEDETEDIFRHSRWRKGVIWFGCVHYLKNFIPYNFTELHQPEAQAALISYLYITKKDSKIIPEMPIFTRLLNWKIWQWSTVWIFEYVWSKPSWWSAEEIINLDINCCLK